ncbi:hypothetical protein PHYBLDRAFT_145042 [Phycomyces blakesleeanus NRRL 1555(-)]|uniref:Uncharacterized protein n=1 Tax=Phycomyces blakesleeanus (strain ATCC 8743b / DSM 1359 / FGSC 10004 / NBRC 33097 / NRRL 1555) TaxID=763407 RepID=A0A163E0U7_PHYB8|nr:hypothetical protein PHYBLDRAFT_145042 [Phycomyces blakesleeanus NRRL 1555(-)]OAD74610.1 hypothetical protein PHYBLDRAFT_145042 [Phycomyces blakesleeanus NRRL 1555(-)]|eukprot:XP_018292650.1 hypothetical protein PHYBLDRAFT_145042 [Phycomyces blakesleeanus NRRL 1555(-)]
MRLYLMVRQPKAATQKELTLEPIEDQSICLVQTTWLFLQKTADLRKTLPEDHTLFLAHIGTSQTRSIRPSTLETPLNQVCCSNYSKDKRSVHSRHQATTYGEIISFEGWGSNGQWELSELLGVMDNKHCLRDDVSRMRWYPPTISLKQAIELYGATRKR